MKRRGFTLIELLVVVGIIVILLAITVPALKMLTKGNNQAQALNLIRATLSHARALAISQHRKVGVVFFDETPANANPIAQGQTAMMFCYEDRNQNQYGAVTAGAIVFIAEGTGKQYLPTGIMVGTIATKNPGSSGPSLFTIKTGNDATGHRNRCIIFDASGQLVLQNGIAAPDPGAGPAGQIPRIYGDWQFILPGGNRSNSVSEPGIVIFDKNVFNDQGAFASDDAKKDWLLNHADLVLVNGTTGNFIK